MTVKQITRIHTSACPLCKKTSIVRVPTEALERYKKGAYIQDAFPMLTEDERELIMTGMHQSCWDLMISLEDD